jgi:phosphodiesterase/alkaline phosphatase D-like protein
MKQITTFFLLLIFISSNAQTYQSTWQDKSDMPWIGEELWANRLQDWQIQNGTLKCNITGKNRSVALLTHKMIDSFIMTATVQFNNLTPTPGIIGFEIGRKGSVDDYRSAAIYGAGISVGINKKGQLVIGEEMSEILILPGELSQQIELKVTANTTNNGVTLLARIPAGRTLGELKSEQKNILGYVGLISNFDTNIQQEFVPSATFVNWKVEGKGVVANLENTYGPIFFAQYTLSNKTLKLSAQCAPTDLLSDKITLSLFENGKWKNVLTQPIEKTSRTASFKIKNWKRTTATPYKLTYNMVMKGEKKAPSTYIGTITPEPNNYDEIKLGLFSCNFDYGFPDGDLREKMLYHDIDAALFLGDQFYEGSGGFGVEVTTLERSVLDYLRKWYQFGWSYRDVFRHVPMISIPDDHDVYHGNVWGEGGKAALLSGKGYERQDVGGYKMPAKWIEMVQHTQTNHLPDAFDPTPVLQNIPVYYTHWNWGPLSFAIVEDRKFKSAPKNIFPPEAGIANGFITNPDFKIGEFNTPKDGELLGKRQEVFLNEWVHDWSHGAQMKVLLSQTSFCTLATLPKGSLSDSEVPSLPVPEKGKYVAGDTPTQDMDSNGWPHNRRNDAVKIIRKGFTLHLAGDQHLASVVRYGVDEHDDSGFAFGGPALNNIWPRRWWPQIPTGHEPIEGKAINTGKFEDGFSNKVTVHAVGNPYRTGIEPAIIHNRATGYGIVKLKPLSREITLECWPRFADPATDRQFDGWPVTIQQEDNYGRKPYGYLPTIKITDYDNAVVQVINQQTNEMIYSLRLNGNEFLPKVFEKGVYTIRYGEPDKNIWQELQNLKIPRFGRRIRTKLFIE